MMNPESTLQVVSNALGTKERILDAAEELFAELGPAGTSLRAITAKAQVNLAAVNYHFRSKDALFGAVFSRRIKPLNEERLAWLDRLEHEAGNKPVAIEKILEALIFPMMAMSKDAVKGGHQFLRILGRSLCEPADFMRNLIAVDFEPLIRRFNAAFSKTLPRLPSEEVWWRMHFTVGAMLHTAYHQYQIEIASKGLCKGSDVEGATKRLVAFTAAGLRAPFVKPAKNKKTKRK